VDNHRLLRIVGEKEEDWPDRQGPNYCCFRTDLETTMREEIGEAPFEKLLADCQREFGIRKRKHALKNPAIISELIGRAQAEGRTCKTLEGVLWSVLKLAGPAARGATAQSAL
jgi:hypothetical protein